MLVCSLSVSVLYQLRGGWGETQTLPLWVKSWMAGCSPLNAFTYDCNNYWRRKANSDKKGTCTGSPDLPCGSPPPFGERFVQKMVWLMWPPPLNLRAGCSATCVVTSPTIQSQMHAVDTKRVDASNYRCCRRKCVSMILSAIVSVVFIINIFTLCKGLLVFLLCDV